MNFYGKDAELVIRKLKSLKVLYLLAAAVLIFTVGFIFAGATLSVSGDGNTSDTSALFTDEILAQAGISLSTADEVVRVDCDGAVSLTVLRAFDVKVFYRGQCFTAKCVNKTVAEAIAAAGITLTGAEEVTPELNSIVTPTTVIEITADSVVELTADGETRMLATKAKTVADFLKEQGIEVFEDDILSADENSEIYDGLKLTLKRVEYKNEVRTETVDYDFITEETDEMYLGVTSVECYGVEGEKEVTYRCKFVDGEMVGEEVIGEEITREPVDRLELVGTYVEPEYDEPDYSTGYEYAEEEPGIFMDMNGNEIEYKSVLTGSATAYYAAEGAYTATGVPVYKGGVAVNPDIIPYGTRLYIASTDGSYVYGYATAVDTGGALMSGEALVDVFYPTYNECVSWGRRNVTVYILD